MEVFNKMLYKELKGVKITQLDDETIQIFGQNPKFVTTISNNPNKIRYHRTFYADLKKIINDGTK